ncbi:MAG: hypothetical protein V3U92_18340 [Cellulophaga sp.]
MISVVIVCIYATTTKHALSAKWGGVFFLYITIISTGIALNAVSPGTLIGGIRSYFKFLPFFFLPIMYKFSEDQMGKQLKLLLFISLIQCPLGIFQKFVQFGIKSSGDYVSGTLTSAGQLPILLACALALVTAFYLRNRINTKIYITFLFLLVIPTTLSESKTSVGFIPLALLLPIYINAKISGQEKSAKKSMAIFLIFVCTAITFVAIYDHFAQYGKASRRDGLVSFFTSGTVEKYVNRGASDQIIVTKLGYYDKISIPLDRLSDDKFKLFFGLGIGNVQTSAIKSLSGKYSAEGEKYGAKGSAIALFLWEIGILGVLAYFIFMYMVFIDAKRLSKNRGLNGIIGLGWCAALMVTFLSLFFKNPFIDNANGYLFWYLSGYVVAARCRLENQPQMMSTKNNESNKLTEYKRI